MIIVLSILNHGDMFDMNKYTNFSILVKHLKTNYHNISKPCLILYSNCTCLKIKLNLFSNPVLLLLHYVLLLLLCYKRQWKLSQR